MMKRLATSREMLFEQKLAADDPFQGWGLVPGGDEQAWRDRKGATNNTHITSHPNAPYIVRADGSNEEIRWRWDGRKSGFNIYPGEQAIIPNPYGTSRPVVDVPQDAQSVKVLLESFGFAPSDEGKVAVAITTNWNPQTP